MPGIPTSCRPIVAFPICGRGRWRRKRQVSPRWLIEPPACSRVDRIVVFINSFRTVVLFFVLLVDFEEGFSVPAGSWPYIRRVNSCIVSSLEQSRVVDLTVAEDHPDSILESNVLSVEFSRLLSRRIADFPRQFCPSQTSSELNHHQLQRKANLLQAQVFAT